MSDDREGFLARWSRRKAVVAAADDVKRDAAPAAAATPPAAPAVATTAPAAAGPASAAREGGALSAAADRGETARPSDAAIAPAAPAAPLATLADVAALTRDSDYARFMAPGVDGAVRNAAMKKLFSDPRFNVMDGLDVYIDDYGKPDPLPFEMLKQLRQSELLGLFRDDAAAAQAEAADAAAATPDNAGTPAPSSPPEPPAPTSDASSRAEDDPDLRLQPDDGDRRPGAGEGARG